MLPSSVVIINMLWKVYVETNYDKHASSVVDKTDYLIVHKCEDRGVIQATRMISPQVQAFPLTYEGIIANAHSLSFRNLFRVRSTVLPTNLSEAGTYRLTTYTCHSLTASSILFEATAPRPRILTLQNQFPKKIIPNMSESFST